MTLVPPDFRPSYFIPRFTTSDLYYLYSVHQSTLYTMAAILSSVTRPSIRHFSAHRPRPDSRAARAITMGFLVSGVVLPFVPPAMESSRQRGLDMPTSAK